MVFSNWSVNEGIDQAALYEEEEEDQYQTEENKTNFVFSYQTDHNENSLLCDDWVICVGHAVTSFITTYVDLKEYDFVATFNQTTKDEKDVSKKTNKQICQLYRKGSLIVCLLQYNVEAKDSLSWISNLLNGRKPSKISVITSSSKSTFIGSEDMEDSDDVDFLRCLKSSQCSQSINVKTLEKGNMIRNLPAAVMSYCTAYKISCMIYMAFTESHFVDVFTLKCFAPILKDINFVQVPSTVLREKLKNFEGFGVADNTVYI